VVGGALNIETDMKEQTIGERYSPSENQYEQVYDGSPFGDAKDLYAYRDLKNCLDTAWRQGVEEGKHQVKVEQAILMLKHGIEVDEVIKYADLSKEEVIQLKESLENDGNE